MVVNVINGMSNMMFFQFVKSVFAWRCYANPSIAHFIISFILPAPPLASLARLFAPFTHTHFVLSLAIDGAISCHVPLSQTERFHSAARVSAPKKKQMGRTASSTGSPATDDDDDSFHFELIFFFFKYLK